jgi:hypothetical protein
MNDRYRPGGPRRRSGFIPLIMLLFNEHSFAVHALKNARLQLIRRQNRPQIPLKSLLNRTHCPRRKVRHR